MKKVLFFIENNWAFGSVHHALCKELYKHNIYANLLDWSQTYTQQEFAFLKEIYDVFVTIPNTAPTLLHYGIEPHKIIIVAHEQTDILGAAQKYGVEFFNQFLKLGVISSIVKNKAQEINITKEAVLVKYGIHFDNFYIPTSNSLKVVGYGGAKHSSNFYGVDRKRGHLVEQTLTQVTDITLLEHKFYNYMCMPSYYQKIDCLLVSSLEDAGGLPAMEAGAAGRMVMSTPVGYFEVNGPRGAGIVLPFEEHKFIELAKNHLEYYRDNPKSYKEKCEQIQQYAYENYDWSKTIHTWINLLT